MTTVRHILKNGEFYMTLHVLTSSIWHHDPLSAPRQR